jgi:hypothetical protein
MFTRLSTARDVAISVAPRQNPRMGKAPDLSTVAGRLEHVRLACGYVNDAAFAKAIGLNSAQTLSNWKSRNSIGNGGKKLHAATGVSTDWMLSGTGLAFPNGPKEAPKRPQIEQLAEDFEETRAVLSAVVSAIATARPDVASDLLVAVRHMAPRGAPSSDWIQGVTKVLAASAATSRRKPSRV